MRWMNVTVHSSLQDHARHAWITLDRTGMCKMAQRGQNAWNVWRLEGRIRHQTIRFEIRPCKGKDKGRNREWKRERHVSSHFTTFIDHPNDMLTETHKIRDTQWNESSIEPSEWNIVSYENVWMNTTETGDRTRHVRQEMPQETFEKRWEKMNMKWSLKGSQSMKWNMDRVKPPSQPHNYLYLVSLKTENERNSTG